MASTLTVIKGVTLYISAKQFKMDLWVNNALLEKLRTSLMTPAAGRVIETSSLIFIRPSYRDIRITTKIGCIEIVCLWRAVPKVTENEAMKCFFSFSQVS
jgi:hypothetical protein